MRDFTTFLVVNTVITFLVVGLVFLILSQSCNWYYLAIASLINGLALAIVIRKI